MSGSNPPMDFLNLICYECDYQLQKNDLHSINTDSYPEFTTDFSCPSCGSDIHPEDSLFQYLREVPTSEIPGRPLLLAGFASVGTKSLKLGEVEEVGLIGGNGLDIDLTLLADTNQPPGQTIRNLQGVQFEWFPGPMLIDDEVLVDIRQVSDSEVGFITSLLQTRAWPVTIGYLIHARRSDIPQPPWLQLLSDAVNHYHMGDGLALISMLFSGFESHVNWEIWRTQILRNRTPKSIKNFLDNQYRFKDLCKDAIEEVTDKHFPTEDPNTYQELIDLRKVRNDGIVHVDPGDSVATIEVNDMKNAVQTIFDSSIAINSYCRQTRQSI